MDIPVLKLQRRTLNIAQGQTRAHTLSANSAAKDTETSVGLKGNGAGVKPDTERHRCA